VENLWNTLGKALDSLWKMENLWNTFGKALENLWKFIRAAEISSANDKDKSNEENQWR